MKKKLESLEIREMTDDNILLKDDFENIEYFINKGIYGR